MLVKRASRRRLTPHAAPKGGPTDPRVSPSGCAARKEIRAEATRPDTELRPRRRGNASHFGSLRLTAGRDLKAADRSPEVRGSISAPARHRLDQFYSLTCGRSQALPGIHNALKVVVAPELHKSRGF